MVLSLKHVWLRLVAARSGPRPIFELDLSRLPERDLADLNLPERLAAAERLRRLQAMGMGRW